MKRLIVIAMVLLIALPLAAALSGMVDLGSSKQLVSRIASRALQRELRIEGDMALHLGLTPRLVAESLAVANPDWAPGDLLRIDQLTLELDLLSLWRGPVLIRELLIDGAEVDLVERENGTNNWTLGETAGGDTGKGDVAGPPPVIVSGLVSDSRLQLMTPGLHSPLAFRIEELNVLFNAPGALQLELRGQLEGLQRPDLPYSLQATLRRTGNLWSVADLELRLGRDELRGELSYLQQARPRYSARLRSQHFNLGQFADRVAQTSKTPAPLDKDSAGDRLLIPDTPLPLSWMGEFDGELDLDLAGLNIRDRNFPELVALDSLRLQASLDNGTLAAPLFELRGDRGILALPMTLQWRDNLLAADLAMSSEEIKLSLLSQSYNVAGLPVQRVRSRFRARGASPHQLASSLSGYLLLESGPGKLNNGAMDRAFDSFTAQLLETINPFFKEDPYTELECGVVGVEFDQGTALLDPGAIFRTSKMDIMATGDVDLATEVLQLSIATKARKGLGLSAASLVTPFLEVTGTLAQPGIGVDSKKAAIAGGAAAATGGLSILAGSLWHRYMDKTDPCELASTQARQRLDETGAEALADPA